MIGITGGSGVLGSILTALLRERNIAYDCYTGDVAIYSDVKLWVSSTDFKAIIHLAAIVPTVEVKENKIKAYETNVLGTLNLIKAIEFSNVLPFVFYSSTSHVYASDSKPLSETSLVQPINSYGVTKRIAEELLLDYAKDKHNFKVCIGRLFSFYHESQKPPFLYPTLIQRVATEDLRKPFQIYGANSTRDFLYAADVCEYILKLVQMECQGIINIGSGKATSIYSFVKDIIPEDVKIVYDEQEITNHLVADVTLLKRILNE